MNCLRVSSSYKKRTISCDSIYIVENSPFQTTGLSPIPEEEAEDLEFA